MYVVLDLETTGFSYKNNNIIEIAAEVLSHEGIPLEDGLYSSLICPPRPIPSFVSDLTGITQDMVKTKRIFSVVVVELFEFINDRVNLLDERRASKIGSIILVAHNGSRFDFPFLLYEMKRNNLLHLLQDPRFGYGLDTLLLSKIVVRTTDLELPSSYKLSDLYEYVTTQRLGIAAHRATADVKATCSVLRHPPFWNKRRNHFTFFLGMLDDNYVNNTQDPPDDSDIDSESNDDEDDCPDVEVNSETGERNNGRTSWRKGGTFHGLDCKSKFEEMFAKRNTRNSTGNRIGVQCAHSSVNSPSKAWRQVFTNAILDKVVTYTNDYGDARCKEWVPVTRQDMTDFFSVLFISESTFLLCIAFGCD